MRRFEQPIPSWQPLMPATAAGFPCAVSSTSRAVVRTPEVATSALSLSALPAVSPATQAMSEWAQAPLRWHRGRVAVLAAMALAIVALTVAVAGALGIRAEAATATTTAAVSGSGGDGAVVLSQQTQALTEHVVAPGDTLWALALAAAPQDDPRETVDRIMRLNDLTSAGQVAPGTVLVLPNAG